MSSERHYNVFEVETQLSVIERELLKMILADATRHCVLLVFASCDTDPRKRCRYTILTSTKRQSLMKNGEI